MKRHLAWIAAALPLAALATVNIEVTAAIPSATVPTAITVSAGVRPRPRML